MGAEILGPGPGVEPEDAAHVREGDVRGQGQDKDRHLFY
jgi:hypothetical protein